ncbi:MAG: inositol 2-dehydrogenase, partial [Oligoflexales bacterium]|nr:inositol 2-dehydrogenase [Oligoflexales bacterium]
SMTPEDGLKVRSAVMEHPELVFLVAFQRRFDPSYLYAKQLVRSGALGRIVLYRAYSRDCICYMDGSLKHSPGSGGSFMDMAVHDIDLARWFVESEPESLWAMGGCYEVPEFARYNDTDNASVMMKFKNEAMAFIFVGKTAPNGYNVEAEIVGTKASLRIGAVPAKNLVEIIDSTGIRRECSMNFMERFKDAYAGEIQEFVNCVASGRKPEITVDDAIKASEIGLACQRSFESGELVKMS